MNKKRTTIYIDEDIVNLAKLENANLSEVAGNLLQTYFQTESIDKLQEKQKELEGELTSVKNRIKDMIRKGVTENRENDMKVNTFNELYEIFKKRIKNIGFDEYDIQQWITSGKNLQRCKIIGKDPLAVLEELKLEHKRKTNKKISDSNIVNQATVGL